MSARGEEETAEISCATLILLPSSLLSFSLSLLSSSDGRIFLHISRTEWPLEFGAKSREVRRPRPRPSNEERAEGGRERTAAAGWTARDPYVTLVWVCIGRGMTKLFFCLERILQCSKPTPEDSESPTNPSRVGKSSAVPLLVAYFKRIKTGIIYLKPTIAPTANDRFDARTDDSTIPPFTTLHWPIRRGRNGPTWDDD